MSVSKQKPKTKQTKNTAFSGNSREAFTKAIRRQLDEEADGQGKSLGHSVCKDPEVEGRSGVVLGN